MKQLILVLSLFAATFFPPRWVEAAPVPEGFSRADERAQDGPEEYVLSAAYPNPFNPTTSFTLRVKKRQQITVDVFNLLGQRVQVLFEGIMQAGESMNLTFDAGDLPSGIYLYRARGDDFVATRQVTLLK